MGRAWVVRAGGSQGKHRANGRTCSVAASPQRFGLACAAQDPDVQGRAGQLDRHQGAPQHPLRQVGPRPARAPARARRTRAQHTRVALRTPSASRAIPHPRTRPAPRASRRPAATGSLSHACPACCAPRSLKAKNAELTIAREAEEKVRVVMDEVRGREDAKKPDLPRLFKEKDELRKSVNEHRNAIRKIQNEFNDERKKFYEFQKVRAPLASQPESCRVSAGVWHFFAHRKRRVARSSAPPPPPPPPPSTARSACAWCARSGCAHTGELAAPRRHAQHSRGRHSSPRTRRAGHPRAAEQGVQRA